MLFKIIVEEFKTAGVVTDGACRGWVTVGNVAAHTRGRGATLQHYNQYQRRFSGFRVKTLSQLILNG